MHVFCCRGLTMKANGYWNRLFTLNGCFVSIGLRLHCEKIGPDSLSSKINV